MNIQEYIQSGIVEAYVLGLADAAEKQEMEQLRAQYPELDAAVIAFEDALAVQGKQQATAPPPQLKQSIWQAIEQVDKAQALTEVEDPDVAKTPIHNLPTSNVPSVKRWQWLAAAALVGCLATGSLSIYLYQQYQNLSQEYIALEQQKADEVRKYNTLYTRVSQLQESYVKKVALPGVEGKEGQLATVYYDTQSGDVYLFPVKLDAPPSDKQYQLWAIVDGQPVDAGMLDANCASICQLKNVKNPQAFAITLEQKGGSEVPTLSAMVVLGGI